MCGPIAEELQGIDLGDKRLNDRSRALLETLAADPAASINAACSGWAETQAAYRLCDNERVEPEKILRPHREATERRIAEHSTVLVVQDTTELDFSRHPTRDAGVLNTPDRFGFYDHSQVAFTREGVCLGVLDATFWSRDPDSLGKADERAADPIETKESARWLRGYQSACELAGRLPQTQIVSVADCECDIYDIFVEAEQHATPADFVIRARVERSTPKRDPEAGEAAYRKVRDEVASSKCLTTRVVELPATPKRVSRTATLEVRAQRVRVKPPHARPWLPEVTLNVVLVEETDGPGDGTDVSWLLLTSLPIHSVEAVLSPELVLRVVDDYVLRWPIETFFRTYKTGCKVEEIQLETDRRLRNALMFYKIIAWRVLHVTMLGRASPELSCEAVFAEEEWKPVWTIVEKTPLPKQPPLLGVFIPILAQLGGYNRRTKDRPPGAQAIWIGIRRMTDFTLAWTTFGPPQDKRR
jgi:hypothetical protein